MIEFIVPIKTISEANVSEHWTKRRKRHNGDKLVLKSALNEHVPKLNLPVKIILTRIAPRKLDSHDNLRIAFKHILDTLADHIIPNLSRGRADGHPGLVFDYMQFFWKT